jgi:hypothetical protein
MEKWKKSFSRVCEVFFVSTLQIQTSYAPKQTSSVTKIHMTDIGRIAHMAIKLTVGLA